MALKKINYNGQSKIILRLCEMVNQLIDGGGGGGSTVAYTQTLSSGTKTGEISIDGVSTDMYAPTQPIKLSDLQNDTNFIDNTVNNLTNYYLKTQTYTQAEVDALISAIVTLNILVVQTLPTQDISTTTIYLVPKQTAETQDIYDEYIYVNNAWELIGTTQIDLSNYYTKTQVDNLLSAKVSDNPTFTEAQTRANIASGESFATILGKIKKWFTDLPSMFVSKSGDTMSGSLQINKQSTSTSTETSNLYLGNNIAGGTTGNSYGALTLFGKGTYKGRFIDIGNILTADRDYQLPNKSGTLALTSDIQDLKFPRQKNLGTFTTTAELEAFLSACNVSTGKFDGDIMIGDYMMIAGYKCYVAGFDTEYNKGDTAMTAHHITCIANFGSSKMNETNTTAGGYEGASTMQAFLTARETELTNVAGTHIKTRRVLTTNTVTDGKSSGWAWTDHKLTLMTETQIYGSIQWGNVYDTGEGYEKLPIFNYLSPLQVFGRKNIWLRGVYSATYFCVAGIGGSPSYYGAPGSFAAVALFCLG